MAAKKISVILPVYFEEENIVPIFEALTKVFAEKLSAYDYEILFVNDGSTDQTLPLIKECKARDPRVRFISFSRNFGQQAGFTAGFQAVSGDAVITMDCDFQDPPELLPEMVAAWEAGSKIVYARRVKRDTDSFFKKHTAGLYYRLLGKFSEVDIPRQVGDFRLVDKVVVKELNRLGEHARYLRGMVAWLGFRHSFVEYERPERAAGETHYTLKKMVKLAMDGLLNFSFLPLKIGLWLGILSLPASVLALVYIAFRHFIIGVHYQSHKWVILIVWFLLGLQFIVMWIIGEYVARIYNDVRGRPMYVVDEEG